MDFRSSGTEFSLGHEHSRICVAAHTWHAQSAVLNILPVGGMIQTRAVCTVQHRKAVLYQAHRQFGH